MDQTFVLTIDGPSGAGKGTLSQLLARKLGFHLLDSGALYRLVALAASRRGIDTQDEMAVSRCARDLDVVFDTGGPQVVILLNGVDSTLAIREEQISMGASVVAAMPQVRAALLERQRVFLMPPGLVADGRDMGTTVFPEAPCKFFLTASAEARAERRYQQLLAIGSPVDKQALVEDIRERDHRDQSRVTSPLRPAEDAQVIDSTSMSIQDVLAFMLEQIATHR